MVRHLGSSLADIAYIFDEPSPARQGQHGARRRTRSRCDRHRRSRRGHGPRRGRRRRARGLSGRLRRLAAGRPAHRPLPIPALSAPAQAPAGDGPTAVAQPVAA
ncbi:hypothetical protein G6F68_014887 [Rhizopus microsporus]|nr:hypothetical protein G6F68_014887 [Rhizopus microsporus]